MFSVCCIHSVGRAYRMTTGKMLSYIHRGRAGVRARIEKRFLPVVSTNAHQPVGSLSLYLTCSTSIGFYDRVHYGDESRAVCGLTSLRPHSVFGSKISHVAEQHGVRVVEAICRFPCLPGLIRISLPIAYLAPFSACRCRGQVFHRDLGA